MYVLILFMYQGQILNSKYVFSIFCDLVQSSLQWKPTALSSSDIVTPGFIERIALDILRFMFTPSFDANMKITKCVCTA